MFEPRSSGAVIGSTAPARHQLARRTRSSLGQNPAKPPLPFAPLKHYFAFTPRNDKYIHTNPARPRAVWPLKNRSEGEVNIFQGFEVNRSVSATLPSSSSHFLFTAPEEKSGMVKAMTGWWNEYWMNSFEWLTVGCNGLLSLCLSLLPGLPCSAPALTVESVSPPNDVCSAQLIALCPHLHRERERERERGREREREREKFKNGAVCKLLMQKCERARSRANSDSSLTVLGRENAQYMCHH